MNDRVKEVRVDSFVTENDSQLFASLLANGRGDIPLFLRSYATSVVSNLAKGNIVLIPELLDQIHFEEDDPLEALKVNWEYLLPDRPLPDNAELERRLWRAQLQVAFPAIELERLSLIADYQERLEVAIHTEYYDPMRDRVGYVTQFNEDLKSASDLEFGTMIRMMNLQRNDDRMERLLSIDESWIRERILLLRDCRNSLAHHHTCTPDQMARLFNPEKTLAHS